MLYPTTPRKQSSRRPWISCPSSSRNLSSPGKPASTRPMVYHQSRNSVYTGDRFIPSRRSMQSAICTRSLFSATIEKEWKSPIEKSYEKLLLDSICGISSDYVNQELDPCQLLGVGSPKQTSTSSICQAETSSFKSQDWERSEESINHSLLSWGYDYIAIGCDDLDSVDFVDPARGHGKGLSNEFWLIGENETVTSVAWCPQKRFRNLLVAGNNLGEIYVSDQNRPDFLNGKCYSLGPNDHDVSIPTCIVWNPAVAEFVSCGTQNGKIFHIDLRECEATKTVNIRKTWNADRAAVKRLKWNREGNLLVFANSIKGVSYIGCIDFRYSSDLKRPLGKTLWKINTESFLEAFDWCPFQRNTLIVGGKAGEHGIGLFQVDALTGKIIASVATQSHISNLVWKYDASGLTHIRTIRTPQEEPVIELSLNPTNGTEVATLSKDKTLRIYDVFEKSYKSPLEMEETIQKKTANGNVCTHNVMWELGVPKFSDKIGLEIR